MGKTTVLAIVVARLSCLMAWNRICLLIGATACTSSEQPQPHPPPHGPPVSARLVTLGPDVCALVDGVLRCTSDEHLPPPSALQHRFAGISGGLHLNLLTEAGDVISSRNDFKKPVLSHIEELVESDFLTCGRRDGSLDCVLDDYVRWLIGHVQLESIRRVVLWKTIDGYREFCHLSSQGRLACDSEQFGKFSANGDHPPDEIPAPIRDFRIGGGGSICARLDDGSLYCMRDSPHLPIPDVIDFDVRGRHYCILQESGDLFCTGNLEYAYWMPALVSHQVVAFAIHGKRVCHVGASAEIRCDDWFHEVF